MVTERIDRYIRAVLLGGMILSVGVMVVGLLMFAVSGGDWEEVTLSLDGIIKGIAQGNPVAVIDLGILLLIATPLMRVIVALMAFAAERETRFVIVALIVLGVVGLALLAGG